MAEPVTFGTAELKQMDPPCNHCYCQSAEAVSAVPHNACCKCGDTMQAPRLVAPDSRLSPKEVRRLKRKTGRINDDSSGRPLPL